MSRREFVISIWRRLGEPGVGADELLRLQRAIREAFGEPNPFSPAAIARLLADEGAELRHPEIIEFDARWRESQLQNETRKLDSLGAWAPENRLGLGDAESLIIKLEQLRLGFDRLGDSAASQRIRDLAIEARRAAITRVEGKLPADATVAEQTEIAEWFGIWLQTPSLFGQWIELRKASREFKQRFSIKD